MKIIVKELLSKKKYFLKKLLLFFLREVQNINLKTDLYKNVYKIAKPHYTRSLKRDIARVKTILKIKNFDS